VSAEAGHANGNSTYPFPTGFLLSALCARRPTLQAKGLIQDSGRSATPPQLVEDRVQQSVVARHVAVSGGIERGGAPVGPEIVDVDEHARIRRGSPFVCHQQVHAADS
jgi:hypothetical protein